MPKTVKSLVSSCQDTLAKYLDVLSDVGCVPYSLLKPSFIYATPQQLLHIEKANPGLALELNELWLQHCLTFKDIREEHEKRTYKDTVKWKDIYMNRYEENERKKQLIKEKVKSQYNKIQSEKNKKSIKVLHGIVPIKSRHSYDSARRSTMSKLFQQTRKETNKIASIYNHTKKPLPPPIIRVPKLKNTPLTQAYDSFQAKYPPIHTPPRQQSPPLIAPHFQLPPLKKLKVDENKKKKPAAVVDFSIFNKLS